VNPRHEFLSSIVIAPNVFKVLICKPQYSDVTISFGNKSTVAWIAQLTNVGAYHWETITPIRAIYESKHI
jgi:hypothetical protein